LPESWTSFSANVDEREVAFVEAVDSEDVDVALQNVLSCTGLEET
jgi:hypothetical protein